MVRQVEVQTRFQTNAVPAYVLFHRDIFEVSEVKLGLSLAFSVFSDLYLPSHPGTLCSLSHELCLHMLQIYLNHLCNI